MAQTLRQWWKWLTWKLHDGQGLVEYALILVAISIVSVLAMRLFGSGISSLFSTANGAF